MAEAFEWTPEQRAVIEADCAELVVTAAAGAGKTLVLVERYLRHVERGGLQPDQILTITFTKKAAAEMKKRIVKSLRERGLDDQAQIAETGPIQTIHSFCERLLRENALEAGLDPGFEILSDAHTTRLVIQCVREVLASALEEEPNASELITFLAGKVAGGPGNHGPYARLETAVVDVLRGLRGSGLGRDDVASWHQNPETLRAHWEHQILSELPPEIRAAYAETDAPTMRERLKLAYKAAGVKKNPAWVNGPPDPEGEEQALRHTCGLVQLACAAWWRMEGEFDKLQSLDFAGLEDRAVRLLERSEVTRKRLREQYPVVMVDEAQDVNPVQYRLLDRIQARHLMMVGDAQQSIYGFRQADVELFRSRAQGADAKWLTKNHRSKEGILRFVDQVFGSLWSDRYVPMNARTGLFDLDDVQPVSFDCVEIWKQEPKDHAALARMARELTDAGLEARELAFLVRTSEGAAEVREALEEAGIGARIAGGTERFYTRIEVRDLANALRCVSDPQDDFALLACLRSPMAGLSLDSIVLLGKEPGVAERLPTFEPPIPEDGEKLRQFLDWYLPLSRYADRLSAWEVLSEIFAKSVYLTAIARRTNAKQLLANARKLLSLATLEPELGPLEYAERIREIQDLRHKEGDAPAGEQEADVATIMTIHKAKGLEFPVVILCQTDKRIGGRSSDLIVDPRMKMVTTKYGPTASLAHKFLDDRKKKRDEEEEERVLYVALTRAKERLCVALVPPGSKKSASKVMSDALGAATLSRILTRDPAQPDTR